MSLTAGIAEAFGHRTLPSQVVDEGSPSTQEYEEARHFEGKRWEEIATSEWDSYSDAVFGFSPDAFLYFLPSILSSSVSSNRPDLQAIVSIVGMLDRGNGPSSWEGFFAKRWPLLNARECRAVQEWLLWLTETDGHSIDGGSLSRAFDTLELLALSQTAIPIASKTR